ncbi:MAG: T9SS type A sorting domain-containing protein [Chitinophagales bacterium]|nr:T9SS type A sorting domain-containing protein [Chitinophagales bacterium]
MKYVILILSVILSQTGLAQLQPIGEWREHLPYNSAIDVTADENMVYCATPYSLFTVDTKDNSIERLSRVTGLSETGVSAIQYDMVNKKLFIAYSNSNIDIIYRKDIHNVPGLKRSGVTGDKTVYNIFSYGTDYYLSTGLGVVVVDGNKYEIKDSWFVGNGGNPVKVNGINADDSFFYAATEEGLKKARTNNANLSNYSVWQLVSGSGGLPEGACKNILNLQGKMIAEVKDSLFEWNGSQWSLFYADGMPVVSSNVSGNKILLCQRSSNGSSKVSILNSDGSVGRVLSQPEVISFPRKAILFQNEPWVADQFGGLSHFTSGSFEQYKPNSPEATAGGEVTVYNGVFYATAGEVNDAWNYQYNGNGIYIFRNGDWANINRYRFHQLDSMLDFITIAIDPSDETVWAGSFGGGLLHIRSDRSFEIFKQNLLIGPTIGDPSSYRISGLAFDHDRNLWISNFGAARPLLVRKSDGNWVNFSTPFLLDQNSLSQIIVDDNNYKWIVSPTGGNGLICYDHGSSIDNVNDDRWKLYRSGTGSGNLPSNNVLCIAKDKNGFIWAGTSNGIGVIQCSPDVFSASGCDAVWPVVKQGNFAGYLFQGQEVRSIAVDGADRKWVATKNGVFLLSPDGEQVVYNFTEDNSPLLSSDVRNIAIDGKTGEVYFATFKGICSFRSTATEGGESNSEVLVFPNPVPPGFSGTIGIRGLVNNAIVKITEMNGRLVYQTRALGGQAVWDGRDYKGKKISSGVYLILISDDGRTEKQAAKIVFIGK